MSTTAMNLALEAMERYQVKRQDFDRFADEITALREALAEQPAQQQYEALEDCKSHYQSWRDALCFAKNKAENEADQSYWTHEIKAFDRTFQALAEQPAQQEPVAKVDANDEGYWADILPDRTVKVGQLLYAEAPQPAQQEPVEYLYRVDVSRRKNNECTTYDHPIYFHSQADASNYCWAVNRTDWPKNTIVIAESAAIKIAPQPAQRTFVGLTDDEVLDLFGRFTAMTGKGWLDLYRMAEAKLKEKNNG